VVGDSPQRPPQFDVDEPERPARHLWPTSNHRKFNTALAGQPPATQAEIIRINTVARPLALQVALLIPILAALIGLINSLRMMRLPDPTPAGSPTEPSSADHPTGNPTRTRKCASQPRPVDSTGAGMTDGAMVAAEG
jgi:hypothetical protein